MIRSISFLTCDTSSSILPGCTRPSRSSRSRVTRAISRRTGSKLESRMTPSSSRSTSTPVAVSNARMLRPSLPIMRPLSSSSATFTTDTVYSATYSVAPCFMASTRISFAFASASSRARSVASRTSFASSSRRSSRRLSRIIFRASSRVRCAAFSSLSM